MSCYRIRQANLPRNDIAWKRRLNFQSTRDSSESTIEDELFPDLNDADYKSNLAHHNGSVHTVDVSEVKKITVVDKIDS